MNWLMPPPHNSTVAEFTKSKKMKEKKMSIIDYTFDRDQQAHAMFEKHQIALLQYVFNAFRLNPDANIFDIAHTVEIQHNLEEGCIFSGKLPTRAPEFLSLNQ